MLQRKRFVLPPMRRPRTPRRQPAALRATVDELDPGIVVLDRARRVQFVNRAFRDFWHVPDAGADSRPCFVKLMYHGRGTKAYAVPPIQAGRLPSPSNWS